MNGWLDRLQYELVDNLCRLLTPRRTAPLNGPVPHDYAQLAECVAGAGKPRNTDGGFGCLKYTSGRRPMLFDRAGELPIALENSLRGELIEQCCDRAFDSILCLGCGRRVPRGHCGS